MRTLTTLLLILVFSSCEKECKLEPIEKKVFDLSKLSDKYYLTSNLKRSDTLLVVDKMDIYQEFSISTLMNYRECEHFKSYTLQFRDENIQVSLRKNDKNALKLDVIFGCGEILSSIEVLSKDIKNAREYIFDRRENCDTLFSEIKNIVLNGFEIKSIETIDNEIWDVGK